MISISDKSKFVVGAVKVNSQTRHKKMDYECAAWWEEWHTVPGVYPVFVSRNNVDGKRLTLIAEIDAVVVNDYFPALWGGVRVSDRPYEPKYVGQSRILRHGLSIVRAIEQTGNSPLTMTPDEISREMNLDVFIDPSWWPIFSEEAKRELDNAKDYFDHCFVKYRQIQNTNPASFNAKNKDWNFASEYESAVGSIAYVGGEIQRWAEMLKKISWCSRYHTPGDSHNSESNREWYKRNTEWASVIKIDSPV